MTTRLLAICAAALSLLAVSLAGAPAADAASKKECMTRQFRDYNVIKAGGVRVLYARGGRKAAARIAVEARRTYPKFKKLLGRVPPSDRRERCFHGPDGKLDVYVTKAKRIGTLGWPEGTAALVHPYVRTESCLPKKPVFAVVRPGVRPAILAHELFHGFQAAYATKQHCEFYELWHEALATWAGNYAYPDDNVEHGKPNGLKVPDFPLHILGYDAWVFPYYLTQRFGPQVIRAIEEARERHPADVHVDKAIPGGFRARFPEFSLYAYNRAPVPGVPGIASTFAQWDALTAAPNTVPLKQLAKGDNPLPMQTLRALSREYWHVTALNRSLRKIEFHNPAARNPDLHVRALVLRSDGRWTTENWDGRTKVEFCRDKPGQDVQQIILAYSNSAIDRKVAPATRIQAETSCNPPLRYRILATSMQEQTNASADHIVCGRQSGRKTFTGSAGAQEPQVPAVIETARGRLDGEISGFVVGGWSGHHLDGCKEGRDACSVDLPPRAPLPDGRRAIGFSVSGNPNDALWTLSWTFHDPEVGFVDAGDPECNVRIWGYFDQEASLRQVPRTTFMQTTPFTLTFEGSGSATNTPNNTNATVNHEWRYSVTLQRVL